MRRMTTLLLTACLVIMAGCTKEETTLSPAIAFRAELVQTGGCAFQADITADYGDSVQNFSMSCDAAKEVRLTLTAPETIAGITATVEKNSGKLTYDGMALEFGLLANGNVAPAAAPALLYYAWTESYIAAAGEENGLYRVTYEKDYEEKMLIIDTWFKNGIPISAELCYNNERILKVLISDFSQLP